MHDRRFDLLVCLVLLALIGLVFGQTISHDFIQYDDPLYVTENPVVQKGLTPGSIVWAFRHGADINYWTPITWLSHMLDCQLFGLRAGLHHLTNVLLHAVASIVLYFVLKNLTSQPSPSAWTAVLFAIHPMHVESVAWIAERKDMLSALFMFLTIAAYARYCRRSDAGSYALALALFLLALMSKPMVMTLPAVLLLLDYWPLRRFGQISLRRLIVEKISFGAVAIACGLVTVIAQRHAGTMQTLEKFPLDFRLTNALVSFARYLGKLFWPTNLAVFYPPPSSWRIGVVLFAACLLAALLTFTIKTARSRPYLVVGLLWFLVTLVPVIGVIQVGRQAMADRYSYIPYIGLFIMLAWGLTDLANRFPRQRTAIIAAACVLTLAATARAIDQTRNWRDTFTLFSHALNVTDENEIAHNQVANMLVHQRNFDAAERHYREAVRLDPSYAFAQMNLGHLLHRRGQFAEAVGHYQQAIAAKPSLFDAHLGLGLTLVELNQPLRAAIELHEALRLKPNLKAAQDALAKLALPTTSTLSTSENNSATE